MEIFYVEFQVKDPERFRSLAQVFTELKRDKDKDCFRASDEWLKMFDDKARAYFWWPTTEERAEHLRLWEQTPVPQRFSDPRLQTSWDFDSMIGAFEDGEYELVSCRLVSADRARMEFNPFAHPFGGSGCMRALIEAFGFQVVKDYDYDW